MSKFNFAFQVLSGGGNDLTNDPVSTRDCIFKSVLSSFHGNPVNIFQVGAIESFDEKFRIGSGWADFFWGEYIRDNGGSLTIVDIDLDHLANSILASTMLNYKISVTYGDAINSIAEGYDIYYLDGSNDPDETLEQFKKISHTKSVVIVDDYRIKGTSLEPLVKLGIQKETLKFDLYTNANHVGVIDMRKGT